MRTGNDIERRAAGRITSKSLLWLGLLIPSVFLGPSVARLPGGQIFAKSSSSGSRAVESQAGDAGWQANSIDGSRVLSMRRPIAFEPNRGQTLQRFKFLGRGDGYKLYIGDREAVLTLYGGGNGPGSGMARPALRNLQAREAGSALKVIGIRLIGAPASSSIEPQDQLPGHVNYLIGNDSRRWHTGIPIYSRVLEREVWPGVDLSYYGNQRRIECDFIVAPRANPNAIELEFVNAGELRIDAHGDLEVDSGGQKLKLLRPTVYQSDRDERREIGGRYVLKGKSQVRFQVAAYDHERPLVIDPVLTLAYSTYLGGSGGCIAGSGCYGDWAHGIAVDSTGSAYVAGQTFSADFPTQNPFQSSRKTVYLNAFATKLSSDGSSLAYSTYLGGSGSDRAFGITVDSSGSAYVTGTTESNDFPTKNPFQGSKKGFSNAFVSKLSADGRTLLYSTYLGGSETEYGYGIAMHSGGSAYVTGFTQSKDFPTKNPFQSSNKDTSGGNAFVTKFSGDGSSLAYSTYLGGSGGDGASSIAVDSTGSAYVTGSTVSKDFPTKNPFQSSNKGLANSTSNAFVTKFSADGSSLAYSTYLGGTGNPYGESGNGIAVDSAGSAYVTGNTQSKDFPTKNPFQSRPAGIFVTKFSADGTTLLYSTYLGGSAVDYGYGIAVDSSGSAYVTGTTGSSDFPTKNPFQGSLKSTAGNAFVTKFSADGSSLAYSTYLGGNGGDGASGIAVDSGKSAYVTGDTYSNDFPTNNPFQTSNKAYPNSYNAFVTKLSFGAPSPTPTPTRTPQGTPTKIPLETPTSTKGPKPTPKSTPIPTATPATTVSLQPSSLSFGGQVRGTVSSSKSATLTNVGNGALDISNIAISGASAADFKQTNNCPSSLSSKAHCTISVTFKPAQLGPATASLMITDNAAGSPQSVALSGTGVVSGPNATLSSTSLTFATQLEGTSSAAQSVTLSDYGTAALSIASIGFTGADPGDFHQTLDTCGSSVAPGASCTISVTFKPTGINTRNASLSITDNAPGSPQTVSLSGTGTVVELNPASLSFGVVQVGHGDNNATTLTNVGSTTLGITNITITGTDSSEFSQSNTCGSSVGAGKSCTITVTFHPAEAGGDGADVSISDNGGGSPQQVPLSGAGCVISHGKCKTTSMSSPAVQSALTSHPRSAVPHPTGPGPVGTHLINLVDREREDPFLANGTKRELLVRLWYPASLDQGCKLAAYTSPSVWNYFSELTRLPLPQVTTNSCLDAPVANGAHPVLVFTHGYTGTFTDYTFLFEDLASRGFVVASIDHTYEATAVEFPDGHLAKSMFGSYLANTWRTDDRSLSFALSARLGDLKFVLNELERLNASGDNPFAGRLDMTKVALAGHSLGGLTTWHGAQQDARFKAAILLDPYLFNASLGPTKTPVMLLAAGRARWREEECQLWSDLHGPRFAVNLRGSEHVTPSDAVWLAKGAIKAGTMGPDKTIAAVRDYVAAFLDANLRGRSSDGLLAGPSSDYPDAVITTRERSLCGASTGN